MKKVILGLLTLLMIVPAIEAKEELLPARKL